MSLDIRHQIMKVPAFRGCDEPFIARVAENTKVFEASPGTAVVSHGEFTKDVYINFDGLLDITFITLPLIFFAAQDSTIASKLEPLPDIKTTILFI